MSIFSHLDYKQHEKVVFHEDKFSGLKAIIAIHDSQRGPAIGGCRMLPYKNDALALKDVLRLSHGMTYKCAIADIPFGGGKSVIIGDPKVHKTQALLNAMGDFVESLQGDYITSFDSGTTLDDIRTMGERTSHVGGILEGAQNASASTAYGVFTSIKAAVKHRLNSDDLNGIKIAVQGLGNVGLRLTKYLKEAGAELYITDTNNSHLMKVAEEMALTAVAPNDIYGLAVDVFTPCALGAVINGDTIPKFKTAVIAGGANNQLATPDLGEILHNRKILYTPDYVANAGGIIDLHYQLNGGDKQMLTKHLNSLGDTLSEIFLSADHLNQPTNIIADKIAESRFQRSN
jgi:leucine dehydrogenase